MFKKLLPAKLAVAAALTLPLVASSAPKTFAQGQNLFGSIAVSPSTGAYGYSWNYKSRQGAVNGALRTCENYAGRAGDCRALVWFQNACGSLTQNSRGWGSGWGTTRSLAQNYALQSCRQNYGSGCRVVETVCTSR
ncbi:MAG: DUF4189 domain-containing protein [Prochloraceae cyanobacterium]|nr:DUF4189 domain-containing protein [Prochloraceae cyanobacterium]